MIIVQPAADNNKAAILVLLQQMNLPTADLPSDLTGFIVALDGDTLVGCIALEQYGPWGLLRSAAVHPNFRNQQVAARLIARLEQQALAQGIGMLFLLTETAAQYFTRKGFQQTTRTAVPLAVQKASEFSHVCPASATVMAKQLPQQQSIHS